MRERHRATYADGKFSCGYCGSAAVYYADEQTTMYSIVKVDPKMVRLAGPGETKPECLDGRLVCRACGEASRLPDGMSVEISEDSVEE